MKINLTYLLPVCVASVLTASIIPVAVRAEEPMAIVEPGDGAMTCPALAAQINTLGQLPAAATPKPKKHGFGFLKVVGAVVPGVGMLNGVAGGLVSSAAAAGWAVAENGTRDRTVDMAAATRETMAGGAAAQQRKARLMTLFDDKHC